MYSSEIFVLTKGALENVDLSIVYFLMETDQLRTCTDLSSIPPLCPRKRGVHLDLSVFAGVAVRMHRIETLSNSRKLEAKMPLVRLECKAQRVGRNNCNLSM